jgi:hypothetical protein
MLRQSSFRKCHPLCAGKTLATKYKFFGIRLGHNGLVFCGENAFLVDAGESTELSYGDKLLLPFPVPLPYFGKELPGGSGFTASDYQQIFCINETVRKEIEVYKPNQGSTSQDTM